MIEFTVIGRAEPAGSKKAFVNPKNKRAIVVDANPNAKGWKQEVARVAAEHTPQAIIECLFDGPVVAEFTFYQPRPKGHFGTGRNAGRLKTSAPEFPTVKPDALKLARAVEDALSGVLYRDDAQIVREVLEKEYGVPARCEVRLFAKAERVLSPGAEGMAA